MHSTPELRRIDSKSGIDPFLKWAGGKRWLLRGGLNIPQLKDGATYFEPFLGAGALFFALQPDRAVLSDINSHLVACYRGLRSSAGHVIRDLSKLPNEPDAFSRIRSSNPSNQLERSVRFLYLNRTAFSGLYRENASGEFNVPFGHYYDREICHEDQLRKAARALKSASLRVGHFATSAAIAKEGDLVYFDPPYISGHQNNGFVRYNRHLFNWEDQIQLAEVARALADRGVQVLISNTAHSKVLSLYKGFPIQVVTRRNRISRDPKFRGTTEEAVISSFHGVVDQPSAITVRSRNR